MTDSGVSSTPLNSSVKTYTPASMMYAYVSNLPFASSPNPFSPEGYYPACQSNAAGEQICFLYGHVFIDMKEKGEGVSAREPSGSVVVL